MSISRKIPTYLSPRTSSGQPSLCCSARERAVAAVLCLLLSAPAAGLAGGSDLLSVVPASADLAVLVDDAPSFIKRWQEAPFSRLWDDQQIRQFFGPLRAELQVERWGDRVKEETGYELEELLGMLSGTMVLFMPDLAERLSSYRQAAEDEQRQHEPVFVVLAEVGDNQDRLRELLLRKIEEQQEEGDGGSAWISEEFRGVEMQIERSYGDAGDEEFDELAWALVNGTLAMASPGRSLEQVLSDLLDEGTDTPLAASASYQSVHRQVSGGDLLLYVNVARMVTALLPPPAEGVPTEGGDSGQPSPQEMVDAFGIDNVLGLFVSLGLEEQQTSVDLGVTFAEPAGLLQILAYGPAEAPQPAFIPEDATAFGAAAFDVQAAWAGIRQVFDRLMPGQLEAMAAQITAASQAAGVELDLRRDLVENLGNELIMMQSELPNDTPGQETVGEPDQVLAISIRQRQGFELALETLKGMAGQGSELFSERRFLDTTIYSLNQPGGGADSLVVSYAVTDGYFLLSLGDSAALEPVLIAMGKPGGSVWQRSDVKAAMAVLPAGAAGIGFRDLAGSEPAIFQSLSLLAEMSSEEDRFCDPSAVPDAGVLGRYLGPVVNGIYRNSDSLVIRIRLLPAEAVGT